MIQADAVSTAQPGLIATIKSLFFSGAPGAGTRVRREPTEAERVQLLTLRELSWGLMDTHELYTDAELVACAVRGLLEPLQEMVRKVAKEWGEPHLQRLSNLLIDFHAGLSSLDEKLIDREDFLEGHTGLDELANNLGVLARGLV